MGANNALVKKPNTDDDLEDWQIEEMFKCAEDPYYFFSNYVKIQHTTRGAVHFNLYPYQTRVIDTIINNQNIIALQPRQSGKSAAIVGYILWETVFKSDIEVGIASHKGSGAKDLMKRFKYAYESLPAWMKPGVKEYNVFNVAFDNNSTVEAATTTENTFRGTSKAIVYLDELAFVTPRIAEEFWTSLLPSLSAGESDDDGSGGVKLIATSTPNGSEGLFAHLWHQAELGENDFVPLRVRNEEVEGRGEAFKKKMLKKMSLTKYRQEYECAFLSDKGTLIASEVLESIRAAEPLRTYRGTKIYEGIASQRLAVGIDVGNGIGQDYSVIQVINIDTLEQVAQYRDNTSGITEMAKRTISLLEYLFEEGAKEVYYTVEGNPIGQGVIELLENAANPVLNKAEFISEYKSKIKGIYITNKNKLHGCSKFKDLVEAGKFKINSRELLTELKFFVKTGASFKAETGMHDDVVMSTIVAMLLIEEIAQMDDEVYENINTLYNFDPEEDDDGSPLPFVF